MERWPASTAGRTACRAGFFQTAAGMATAFVAMNEVYGPLMVPRRPKPRASISPRRADGLKDQFIMDVPHFLRDDTRWKASCAAVRAVGKAGIPRRSTKPQTIDDLKYPNWFKEFSRQRHQGGADQRLAVGGPRDWFLTNDEGSSARPRERRGRFAAAACPRHLRAGLRRLDGRGRSRHRRPEPDSWKGYTVGDNTNRTWRVIPGAWTTRSWSIPFEKIVKAGHDIGLRAQGLYPTSVEKRWPHLTPYARSTMSAKAARTGRKSGS